MGVPAYSHAARGRRGHGIARESRGNLLIDGRLRWAVCFLLFLVTSAAFMSRFALSVAAHGMQQQFGLTNVQIGAILSSFILGYGIFQAPFGVATDVVGPYRMLGGALLLWSALTALTPVAASFAAVAGLSVGGSVGAVRFLMGVAQAAVLPAANKTVAGWMPLRERATGNSLFMVGLGIGGAVTPPLCVALMTRFGWPSVFYVLGGLGILTSLLWFAYSADTAVASRYIGRAELEYIRAGGPAPAAPVRDGLKILLTDSRVWPLVLSYGVAGYPSYVFFTWFFLYLARARHIDVRASGVWSMLPYIAIACMVPVGGRLSDMLTHRFGARTGRLAVAVSGSVLACVLIVAGARCKSVPAAVLLLAAGAGFHLFGQVSSWAAATDLAGSRSATLFGIMNTSAQLTGAVAPLLTPVLAERFGWQTALDFAAGMALLAGMLWWFIRPERPILR